MTPSSSTSKLKTATSAGTKKLTAAASKPTPDDKKKRNAPSSQSPILTKKATSASKKVPTSSPSLRQKQHIALHKASAKTDVAERMKQVLHQHTPKSSTTPSSSKRSSSSAERPELRGEKKGEVRPSGAKRLEKSTKAQPGIPEVTTETHTDKQVSDSEGDKTVHLATHQVESDYSLTSVGSGASAMGSESSWLHVQWTVSTPLLATKSEEVFGITIPNVVICGDKESELLETIAMHVKKWKMLGRYLGVDDDSLDEIEAQNHFIGERCLKMLKKFQMTSDGGTYLTLASALKNIMQDSLITDISQFFPKDLESKSTISVSRTIKSTVKVDEMYARLSEIRGDFEAQKNNGRSKATVQVSYPQHLSHTNSPMCFRLTSLDMDSIRVIEDVCIAAAVRKIKQLSIVINYE